MDGASGRFASALVTVLIIWTYAGLSHNPLLERPLLSEVLVLAFTAALSFLASYATKWWPGANGRFDHEHRYRRLEESKAVILPQRPGRLSAVWLIMCIVSRLELLRWLQRRPQCSQSGVETLLPIALAIYSHYGDKKQSSVGSGEGDDDNDNDDDDDDDMGNDTFQDIAAWFIKSSLIQNLGTIVLALGAFVVFQPGTTSTVICPSSQSRHYILALQLVGVALDACILTLTWRTMQWARTSRQRFLKLGTALGSAALFVAVGILVPTLSMYSSESQFAETSHLGPLFYFHVLGQSLVLLTVSTLLFALQYPPLSSTGVITFVCGVCAAWRKLALLGTYESLSKAQVCWATVALGAGFVIFAYRNHVRHILFGRGFITFAILAWMIGTMVYTALIPVVLDRHPINRMVYEARQDADRWKVQKARVSERLPIAVKEYVERHDGRKPPPKFDAWWQYAMDRDSQVIDHFPQIDDNINPFLAIKPKKIRKEIAKLGAHRGIVMISIKQGEVTSQPSKEPHDEATTAIISDLVELIKPFAKHLADMELPVNLLDVPRVLVPMTEGVRLQNGDSPSIDDAVPPWEYRQLIAQSCPGNSLARAEFHSHNGEICAQCVNPHSLGHFMADVVKARDMCHQPDMLDLHGFFMSQQPLRPFSDLVPVFSRAKAEQFQDILIPLSRTLDDYKTEADKVLTEKENRLFWRGKLVEEAYVRPRLLVGGHQERLSHMANNASDGDYITILLSKDGDKVKFLYEKVPLGEANHALKMDIGFSEYETCTNNECEEAKTEFGIKPENSDGAEQHNSRYVMVMDDDAGPPSEMLKIMRSSSIPFVATIFKEWYSDRIFPWLHYVPIDLRFHGLHSTVAYFMGLAGKGPINGRNVEMQTRIDDARWISEQGKQWASYAIRREDAEIYMFRLLLEWGRVIDDKRDDLGYEVKPGKTG